MAPRFFFPIERGNGLNDGILEFINVGKEYSGHAVLKGINMDVRPGEIHALIGENGAGKSTLNKILSGVEQYDEGTYLFNGQQVRFRSAKEAMDTGISLL